MKFANASSATLFVVILVSILLSVTGIMFAAGIESNAYGLAKMYSDVCSNIVVDSKDKTLIKKNSEFRYESL